MNTWRPSVTPVGEVRPQANTYTRTSLAKSPEVSALRDYLLPIR